MLTLERVFEIVNNRQYKDVEFYKNEDIIFREDYVKIHMENGSFIKINYNWYLKGKFLREKKVRYCTVNFFIPGSSHSVATFSVEEDINYDMYTKLVALKYELSNQAIENYF